MGLLPTTRKVMAMPARKSKAAARTKSATRKKATTRKKTAARRKPAAKKATSRKNATTRKKATTRRKTAAKKATTRKKTAARRKPAAKTSEQLGANLSPPEPVRPIMPVTEPRLIPDEPTPQPTPPVPGTEEAEEGRFSTDFSQREEEPGKDS
jgi:hypothetical protein